MATQKFIPVKGSNKQRVGNSLKWSYSYDGQELEFYYDGSDVPSLQTLFPENTVCIFIADGKNSEVKQLEAPKNKILKEFWKRGFYKGHLLAKKPYYTAYGFIFSEKFRDSKAIGSVDGWKEVNSTGQFQVMFYRDMVKDNKVIASAYYFKKNQISTEKWFWYDQKRFTFEDCEQFFKDCPIPIKWDL